MSKEVLIHGIGKFVISAIYSDVGHSLLKEKVKVGRTILKAGEETDLDGYYDKAKVIYAGCKQLSATKVLYFYYGDESDLFEYKHYFQIIHLINKNKLFVSFSHSGGRDFNFINGKWDWERKSSKIKNCNIGTEPKE